VRLEIQLHAGRPLGESPIRGLIERLELARIYDRSPFTLSGGEQAMVVIASCLALDPDVLAIDCALEQVDDGPRSVLVNWIANGRRGKYAAIADNSLSEWSLEVPNVRIDLEANTSRVDHRCGPLQFVDCSPIAPRLTGELRLDRLQFAYCAGAPIIRNASARLCAGAVYVLAGKNGVGKTTLSKIVSGLLRPQVGQVLLRGNSVPPWDQPGRLIGYHFQNPDVQLFTTRVEDEICIGLSALGYTTSEVKVRRDWALEAFGLSSVRAEHPLDLPFVARKRIALASILAAGLPWIVLDEPTLGQDQQSREAIRTIISALSRYGTGFVVVSHSQSFRKSLQATSLLLQNGTLTVADRLGPE